MIETLLSARRVIQAGEWSGTPADTVILDHDLRHRRRRMLRGVNGLHILLDLPAPVVLRHGEALELEDGRFVAVEAEPEELVEIEAPDAASLIRLAWHLGNRHLPTQLAGNCLRIRRDHVIEAMVVGLGGMIRPVTAPFDPEGGAYGGHAHGHE